jgi:hypothetical protein
VELKTTPAVPQPEMVVLLLVKLTTPVGAIVEPTGRPMVAVKVTG